MATKKKATKANPKTPKAPAINQSLRKIHLLSAVVFGVLAVLSTVLIKGSSYQLTKNYITTNQLTGTLSPAQRVAFEIDIKWMLASLLALLAFYSVLHVTRWQKSYNKALSGRIYFWRWVFMGIAGAIMIETIGMLSGINDIVTLKLMGGLTALAAGLGWLAERQNEKSNKPVLSAFSLAALSAGLPWLAIASYAGATSVHGMVNLPWYVYAAYGVILTQYLLVAINQFNQYRRFRNWKNYELVERNYLTITLVGKAVFAIVLIIGFRG